MNISSFDTRFSVVCLPESPSLFMLNMQVYEVRRDREPNLVVSGEPQASVWCAVYQRPLIKKP